MTGNGILLRMSSTARDFRMVSGVPRLEGIVMDAARS